MLGSPAEGGLHLGRGDAKPRGVAVIGGAAGALGGPVAGAALVVDVVCSPVGHLESLGAHLPEGVPLVPKGYARGPSAPRG